MAAQLWVIQQHRVSALNGDEARLDKRRRILSFLASAPDDEALVSISQAIRLDGFGTLPKREARTIVELTIAMALDAECQAKIAMLFGRVLDGVNFTLEERAPALAVYRSVAARWPQTPTGRMAAGIEFDAENLSMGRIAPDIVGADVDGEPI